MSFTNAFAFVGLSDWGTCRHSVRINRSVENAVWPRSTSSDTRRAVLRAFHLDAGKPAKFFERRGHCHHRDDWTVSKSTGHVKRRSSREATTNEHFRIECRLFVQCRRGRLETRAWLARHLCQPVQLTELERDAPARRAVLARHWRERVQHRLPGYDESARTPLVQRSTHVPLEGSRARSSHFMIFWEGQ